LSAQSSDRAGLPRLRAPVRIGSPSQVPAFRAAFHCGEVVTAEIGLERRKIASFGDALNTASRLEGLAKQLGESVVVSGDLLDRLGEVPSRILITELGVHPIRGRDEPLRIAAAKSRVG